MSSKSLVCCRKGFKERNFFQIPLALELCPKELFGAKGALISAKESNLLRPTQPCHPVTERGKP